MQQRWIVNAGKNGAGCNFLCYIEYKTQRRRATLWEKTMYPLFSVAVALRIVDSQVSQVSTKTISVFM